MLDHEHIARVLAELGKREAKATRELMNVQAERCRFLSGLAQQTGNAKVAAASVEPKD